jgi:N-acetylneuraminic acid mutarotase
VAAQSLAGVPGEFEVTGSMAISRFAHTATLLPNGKVLAAGGDHFAPPGGPDQKPSELYDPATGTWTATGPLNQERFQHTATLLLNGDVLVAGGFVRGTIYPNALGSAELYNPSSGAWTPTGSLSATGEHTATLLPNGKVLVAGGHAFSGQGLDLHTNAAALYDPASGTWSATGSMADRRARHTATLLPNGKVLVAGGYDWNSSSTRASAELYNPATGTWTPTGNLTEPRSDHTATLLHGGKVLVTGGRNQAGNSAIPSAELYDPSTGTWTPTGSLAGGRAYHTATLLASNRVLVTGGSDGNGSLATAELYDPTSGNWTSTGSLRQARADHTAILLPDTRVLIAGGGSNDSRTAELYTEPPVSSHLLNISTRLHIQTGDNAMIGGFIITGAEPKTVLVRAIGPSLGIAGALTDPVIEVHGPSGELLATNDNWGDAATKQQIIDSGLAPKHELESALWGVINPGAYTVVVRGKDGAAGIGLFEVYDLDQNADAILANVATRGLTQTADDVMIGGIIVGGGTAGATTTVVVRAIGPSLPISGALADPTLELRDGNGGLVAFNDDWKTRADGSSQQAEIEATTIPPSANQESALRQVLAPDNYTAIVRGKNNTTGIALVEVYNLR